jgi:PhzF family phenazine biosynthesis protein
MRIFQVDAFTSRPYSGNPATVVLDAERLNEAQFAQVAREFPHAETAFVLPPTEDDHDVCVRFFNSRKEAKFVGHATLALHHVLLALGLRGYGAHRQKSLQGIIDVSAVSGSNSTDGALFEFRQTAADLDAPLAPKDTLRVVKALGLTHELLHPALPALVARKANTRLLLPVTSASTLSFIKPDFTALVELGAELGIEGFFPFAIEQGAGQVRTHSRMFCPALGIPEDPVSGNAHAMLATYLWRQPDLRPFLAQFTGLQGEYVNRPGTVNVRLEVRHNELIAAYIGGHAITVSEGKAKVPAI